MIVWIAILLKKCTCAVCKYLDLDISFYFANDLQLMNC